MSVNKVEINGQTVIDLTQDTVTPESLGKGITAHDKSGAQITGTLEASSSGGAKETWVLNESIDDAVAFNYTIKFYSNNTTFESIQLTEPDRHDHTYLSYGDTIVSRDGSEWNDQAYRKLIFDAPPTGDLLTWLQANGVKQPANLAVQSSKDVTITSNETQNYRITPDVPYDALKRVNVTVNVSSGGGGEETTQLEVETVQANVSSALFCLWQTSNGWMNTSSFNSQTDFTIPNVIVGGYVIITQEPLATSEFSTSIYAGVENIGVGVLDAEWGDLPKAALVMKVTATSPKIVLLLRS